MSPSRPGRSWAAPYLNARVIDGCVQVNPQFYAFRWITLLLTQEFSCPDVVRLWDTILSDPGGRADCLQRICVAMLLNLRSQLLQVGRSHRFSLVCLGS